jgi:hypothetical protein
MVQKSVIRLLERKSCLSVGLTSQKLRGKEVLTEFASAKALTGKVRLCQCPPFGSSMRVGQVTVLKSGSSGLSVGVLVSQ